MTLIAILAVLGLLAGCIFEKPGDTNYAIETTFFGMILGVVAVSFITLSAETPFSSWFFDESDERYELEPINNEQDSIYYLQADEKGYIYSMLTKKGEHKKYIAYDECCVKYEEESSGYLIIHKLKYNKTTNTLLFGLESKESITNLYEFHIPEDSILN